MIKVESRNKKCYPNYSCDLVCICNWFWRNNSRKNATVCGYWDCKQGPRLSQYEGRTTTRELGHFCSTLYIYWTAFTNKKAVMSRGTTSIIIRIQNRIFSQMLDFTNFFQLTKTWRKKFWYEIGRWKKKQCCESGPIFAKSGAGLEKTDTDPSWKWLFKLQQINLQIFSLDLDI